MYRCIKCDKSMIVLRGLCRKCYMDAKKRISNGETTWDALITEGLAMPAQKIRLTVIRQRRSRE